jgi:hypothetical protein
MSHKLVIGIAGAIHVPFGLASAYIWMLFSAMFVPICPHFGLDAPLQACRNPVIAIYGSLAISAVGLALVLAMAGAAIGCRLRRSPTLTS